MIVVIREFKNPLSIMPRSNDKILRRLLKAKPSEIPAWAISLAQGERVKSIGDVQALCAQLENGAECVTAIHLALLDIVPIRHQPSATRSGHLL